jgi:hypothetical protein
MLRVFPSFAVENSGLVNLFRGQARNNKSKDLEFLSIRVSLSKGAMQCYRRPTKLEGLRDLLAGNVAPAHGCEGA